MLSFLKTLITRKQNVPWTPGEYAAEFQRVQQQYEDNNIPYDADEINKIAKYSLECKYKVGIFRDN